jgi:hypothetical protein
MYETLADLALIEEAWARLGGEALFRALGIQANTVNLWRRRHRIPAARRAELLALIAAHPSEEVRTAQARIQHSQKAEGRTTATRRQRDGNLIYLTERTP